MSDPHPSRIDTQTAFETLLAELAEFDFPALVKLARECDASAVYWSRRYEPSVVARDEAVRRDLRARGMEAESFGGGGGAGAAGTETAGFLRAGRGRSGASNGQ